MNPRALVPTAIAATLLGFVDPFPAPVRALFALIGFGAAFICAGHLVKTTTPAPADHLPRASTTTAPAPRVPMPMFAGLNVQPPAPEPPPGIDPETGEILQDQPHGSAGSEPERPSPSPSPASTPPAEPVEPSSAPVGLGTFVRWVKADRSGLGQIVSIGTEEAEIRPAWPCPTRQLSVPLRSITPITPHELSEALQCTPTA